MPEPIPDSHSTGSPDPSGGLSPPEDLAELGQRYVELCEALSILSHDLRTPLTTIRGYAQLLQRQARADEYAALRPNIGLIISECDRLAAQSQLLLDIGRIATGRVGLLRKPVDLHHATLEVVRQLDSGISLSPEHSPGDVTVHADVSRVAQMVQAMLRFAVNAPSDVPVHASVDSDGQVARVVIEHGGPPLAPEQRERLLTQLVRLTDDDGHRELGHLDLVIAAGVARAHGGQLDVVSPAQDGRGMKLTLSLPLSR